MEDPPRPIPGGVIEGFYGPPWSDAERQTLLDWMARFGLAVYLYCPKDDPHHRAAWREPYPRGEAERIAGLITDCRKRRIDFIWGVGPGLDLRHADEADVAALLARFAELLRLGCRRFALLLDDIPDALDPADTDADLLRRTLEALQGAHEHLVKRLAEALETTLGRLRETDRGRRALGGYGQASVGGGRTGARLGRW